MADNSPREEGSRRRLTRLGIRTKFFVLLGATLAVALVASTAWTWHAQQRQTLNELREQGQALSQQMEAVWEFMAANQDRFSSTDFSQIGTYQGLHCAIAGRTIAKLFTLESDYITRFVNFEPRNREDLPDDFESEALRAFSADPSLTEYYAIVDYQGVECFRYMAPMRIQETCLSCHGSPKGEPDVTGAPKEGLAVGDLGGAVSIVIPMDVYDAAMSQNMASNVLFFLAVLIGCLLIVYFGMSTLVIRPVGAIRQAFDKVGPEPLDVKIPEVSSSAEMDELALEFNDMSSRLAGLYGSLEAQVAERTTQLAERTGQLVDANARLEEQSLQLQAANERLAQDNRYKSDFLAMMSHELRTPLTSILAFSEMLAERGGGMTPEEEDMRRELEANSRVMLMMINDILEMSRVEAGRVSLEVEPVEVGDVLSEVEPVIRPLAERGGLDLSVEIEPDVPLILADFDKVRRAVENLAGNACKFTPEGGSVRIRASFEPLSDMVRIDVSDTGIGIAPKDRELIFERFSQADASISRKFNGTGLGLPLAREYVELHGGTLTVESEQGVGSTFSILLPVGDPEGYHG